MISEPEQLKQLFMAPAECGAATEDGIDAEPAREDTATGRERAANALASIPTAEAKERAWREAVEESGRPNSVVDAIGPAAPSRLGVARGGRGRHARRRRDRIQSPVDERGTRHRGLQDGQVPRVQG